MNLSFESLQVLDAIERRGSFAAAAAELDRVPSALTYLVRKLEDDLDVLLFDRSGHKARLTEIGRALLDDGRRLLRDAHDLEDRIKRMARGWEVELRIAVDSLVGMTPFLSLVDRFDRLQAKQQGTTRLRLSEEVLGGTWDALVTGRVDLGVGVSRPSDLFYEGEPSRSGAGFQSHLLGAMAWRFCVAPGHPLASAAKPLSADDIAAHRGVAVGDSSRRLNPRSAGIIAGQPMLTVPTMRDKRCAQLLGLGCGWLPDNYASASIERGALIVKQTETKRPPIDMFFAWPSAHRGKAMKLWINLLKDADTQRVLLQCAD